MRSKISINEKSKKRYRKFRHPSCDNSCDRKFQFSINSWHKEEFNCNSTISDNRLSRKHSLTAHLRKKLRPSSQGIAFPFETAVYAFHAHCQTIDSISIPNPPAFYSRISTTKLSADRLLNATRGNRIRFVSNPLYHLPLIDNVFAYEYTCKATCAHTHTHTHKSVRNVSTVKHENNYGAEEKREEYIFAFRITARVLSPLGTKSSQVRVMLLQLKTRSV